jgi:hypothetical protein
MNSPVETRQLEPQQQIIVVKPYHSHSNDIMYYIRRHRVFIFIVIIIILLLLWYYCTQQDIDENIYYSPIPASIDTPIGYNYGTIPVARYDVY